jgi:hypothetical protein
MHLVIDRAAPARPAPLAVWPAADERPWRRVLAVIWRDAMDAWLMMARYRIMTGTFW